MSLQSNELNEGASDKPDRAVVNGAASVSAVPASIPSALSEQAGTISISGNVVRVDCDNRVEAEQLFEWLLDVVEAS